MYGEIISTITTPLALAALVLLLGAGIVRLILRNRLSSGIAKTIVQYGFWMAATLSILANLVFAFQASLQTESLISGSVRSDEGIYLPYAIVDIRGTARAITDDHGSFTISIPRSRMEDSYELDVSLHGYEMETVTVKPGERTAKVTLSLKQLELDEFLSISPNVRVGHYLGLPQIDLEVTMSNPTINEVLVSDIVLTVTPKDKPNEKRTLPVQYMYLEIDMPTLPLPEPRRIEPACTSCGSPPAKETQREYYAFMEHIRADIHQFNIEISAIISSVGIQNLRIGRDIIPENWTYALERDMEQRWFWNPGNYELELLYTVDGNRFHATGTIQLSEKEVMEMKNISKYYGSGYGLAYGFHYTLVGDAKPALTTPSNFVYAESE